LEKVLAMTFRFLIDEVREVVSIGLEKMGHVEQEFDVLESPRKEFGDLTCNVAFKISKKLKAAPYAIAEGFTEKYLKPYLDQKKKNGIPSLILSIEPHPAGYINFQSNFLTLASLTLKEVLEKNQTYGFNDYGHGSRITIEHTSVNPNKALHVGHLRNIVLGDTIYRILQATNHKVLVLNYIDNLGLQVADLVVGFMFLKFPLESPDKFTKFDHYCGDEVYVKTNEVYQNDASLEKERRAVLREIEEGSSHIAEFASKITTRVLTEQLNTCWRMKCRYDLLNFESHIVLSNLWNRVFEILKEKEIVTLETQGKNKGCWVIKQANGESKVLVRSDGTLTYIAKDIPYATWKLGIVRDPFYYYKFAVQWDDSILWATTLTPSNNSHDRHPIFNSADKVITVIDSRQSRLQTIISQVLSQMEDKSHRYYHLGYETVTLSSRTAKMLGLDIGDKQSTHMSGRKGHYVNADYVLDKLHGKAYEEVRQRNCSLSEDLLNQISEEIAICAIRYNLIKYDLDKIITFDILESLSLEGDTGPYLQYAFARAQRILEKSEKPEQEYLETNVGLLTTDLEFKLLKEISKFDLVMEESATTISPKLVARYAHRLATAFNLFYERIPVLREPNKEVVIARLALVKAFTITLKNALGVLGIKAIERM